MLLLLFWQLKLSGLFQDYLLAQLIYLNPALHFLLTSFVLNGHETDMAAMRIMICTEVRVRASHHSAC